MAIQQDEPKGQTIVLTGGGSGGHILPVLAVAKSLKRKRPDLQIVYVGHKSDSLADLVLPGGDIDKVCNVNGGKWRRYHGEGWRQIFDLKTLLKNTIDFFRLLIGTIQSLYLLKKIKPEGVFIKGAYVGVPIGWAARWCHIPYVTLDLDAVPSLANRLIAKKATAHAVGMPKELYSYPPDKTFYVGVPIVDGFNIVTPAEQARLKAELQLDAYEQVILVVGGGLGASRLNTAFSRQLPNLLSQFSRAVVVHVTGRKHEDEMNHIYDKALKPHQRKQVIVKGFVESIYRYTGAADIIVSRAGATSLAEFAAQGKACIIVPNPILTGGHQLKNAQQLAAHSAIIVVDETEPEQTSKALLEAATGLLSSPAKRAQLGASLHTFAHPKAADELADLLLKTFNISSK